MTKNTFYFPFLSVVLVGLCLLSLSWGRYTIPPSDVIDTLLNNSQNEIQHNIIFNLRLPRILAAILVGVE